MRYLKTNTATTITVGPFLDKTDGITPETAITVTGIHITFIVDNAGTPTLAVDADATASGGNNDMVHVTNDDAGYYTLELTAANTNYLGGALLSLNVVGTACPVFHEFTILPAQVYDSLIAGSDLLDANASQLGGTAQTGRDIGASVLLSNGTGTGQLKLASGYVAMTWADIASPSTTVNLSGTTISAVSGAVGSVTGAVGSVTGAVGSVTGAVGSVTADVGITQTAADKVWGTTTRILTAGTNIVLVKGVGITGFNDIAATDIVSGGAITTSGGVASADTVKMNGTAVLGTGTSGDLWRG